MSQNKILLIVEKYKLLFVERGIPVQRIDTSKKFNEVSEDEVLAHAHHLAENVIQFIDDPDKWEKTNKHFAALQMCLSFAGWYTLDELMDHNRP